MEIGISGRHLFRDSKILSIRYNSVKPLTEQIGIFLIFEEDLEHEQLTKDKIYNLIRHQRNLIPNFHTDKLIEIINKRLDKIYFLKLRCISPYFKSI